MFQWIFHTLHSKCPEAKTLRSRPSPDRFEAKATTFLLEVKDSPWRSHRWYNVNSPIAVYTAQCYSAQDTLHSLCDALWTDLWWQLIRTIGRVTCPQVSHKASSTDPLAGTPPVMVQQTVWQPRTSWVPARSRQHPSSTGMEESRRSKSVVIQQRHSWHLDVHAR